LGDGLGEGLGDGFGDASGDGFGVGLPLGDALGVGFGLGVGVGLGGIGLGSCAGTVSVGVTGTGAGIVGVVVLFFERRVVLLGFAGPVTSAGAGPASAGLETSAPAAAGIVCVERRVRRLAILEPVVNEHGWPPDT
jgi:hypothetical protein